MSQALRLPNLSRLSPITLALRCTLLGLTAAVGSLAEAQNTAQAPSRAASLEDVGLRDYNIPAGPLGASLGAFTSQSGLLLSFDPGLTRGHTAPALQGRHTVLEGLQRLLSNTRLQVTAGAAGTYLLSEPRNAPDSTAELSPVVISAERLEPHNETYTAPRSSVYLSSEDIDRYGRVSVGDLLKGVPGVQVGDSRNGGALDVNIRGVQGQSRVAVKVDGAEQALDVYRGYAGTQQRSYIDPELISSVTINKGPSTKSGAIGGTVEMQTIGVKDILVDGNDIGVRFTGNVWNNGVAPQHRSSSSQDEDLSTVPHDDRGSLFGSQAQSGSAAFAYRNERLDLVAAYAHRNQGNYFSGRKGQDRYRIYDRRGREENSVATVYEAGEEVLNSSSETESYLLKATWRIADEHSLDLGYRRYDGRNGEIMPSDIFRLGTAGIYQYPLSEVKIDSYTANYHYLPESTPLVDLSAGLWMTQAKSDTLTSVLAPLSQSYRSDRNWTRQDNRRIGGHLNNVARLETDYGDFKLELSGSFQFEELQPQKSVVTTLHDINANRTLRDASRQEYGLNGKLEYKPIERLTLWSGGRYSYFSSKDHNISATARRERRDLRFITVSKPDSFGSMMWFPDRDGKYTDATDPRLHNGIVSENLNSPFEGIPFDEIGEAEVTVSPAESANVVTGYDYAGKRSSSGSGFSPAFGVNFELAPDTFAYVSYTQGLRLPSLFETSLGTLMVDPGKHLKPERSRSWEIGISTLRDGLLSEHDSAAIKLAYFNNTIKNYITRYYDPSPERSGQMTFSNTDSYQVSGLELQSNYDAGRVFADLSATYYLKTETCDAAFAAKLRASANEYQHTVNTPNCTPGSFMGSYTNTQNPPRLSTNLTTGLRFFEKILTLGGRMTYTSGPTTKMDKPWQSGATTPQIEYRSVLLFDLFLNYKPFEHTELNLSLQNLTDRYYLDPLAQSFMPAPGRTLRLGVNSKF
ncbi:TonB-dependent receptor [Pseudomonas aeruginosa]|uniref:TonB-dependent receptor n=1 Tax=Pseudomonas aeruginosa TaxID=287 RepID=UPI000D69E1B9|nr:TonB-dependent receptor [Pseudomonas aeruginosa]